MIGFLLAIFVVTNGEQTASIDSYRNEIVWNERRIATHETPIDAVFADDALFVVERDSRTLARFERNGARREVALAADPSFVRTARGAIFVYSRVEGIVQEIDPRSMRVLRAVTTVPFASDFEVDGRTAYLVIPQEAKIRTFDLATLKPTGSVTVGAVPVDATIQKGATALSAATLAVADPSSKRVWIVEGRQSPTAAFARGFVRGFLGLGLFRGKNAEFPTGVDRVVSGHGKTLAYDSATGTLYEVGKSKSVRLAERVAPGSFALTERGPAIWENGRFRLIR
jgi:hypothetical protein